MPGLRADPDEPSQQRRVELVQHHLRRIAVSLEYLKGRHKVVSLKSLFTKRTLEQSPRRRQEGAARLNIPSGFAVWDVLESLWGKKLVSHPALTGKQSFGRKGYFASGLRANRGRRFEKENTSEANKEKRESTIITKEVDCHLSGPADLTRWLELDTPSSSRGRHS